MSVNALYLGDTTLDSAAAYLAGLMHHWGWSFDYVPSSQAADAVLLESTRSLFVLSDYPATQLSETCQRRLVQHVADGAGLLMLGGWESFHGVGGDWDGTPVAEILPVMIQAIDDRTNSDHPLVLVPSQEHEILQGLPWHTRTPYVGGMNRFHSKPDARVILNAQHLTLHIEHGEVQSVPGASDPMLVIGNHGAGRTAALATDVAPHWVGGLVDWGEGRVSAQAPDGEAIEVGDLYARFCHQLLGWTANA